MRDGFVFYRSFLSAIKRMEKETGYDFVIALCEYALDGTMPNANNDIMIAFDLVKSQIDANNKRYEAGKRGGRPKKNTDKKTIGFENENHRFQNEKPKEKDKDKDKVKDKDIYTNSSPAANIYSEIENLFCELWKLYPLKRGKSQVSKRAKTNIYKIGFDEMERAINRYVADLEKDDWRKPQNGSTFFNSGYVDYLDENYSDPPEQKTKQIKNKFTNFPQRQWNFDEMEKQEEQRRERERREMH